MIEVGVMHPESDDATSGIEYSTTKPSRWEVDSGVPNPGDREPAFQISDVVA
jgi:hypothetical protein